MTTKAGNPKDAVGIKKTPFSTISAPVMAELGVAMAEGAMKYGRHNYRAVGVRASVYYDALFRHMVSFWEGEDIDPDSGLSHITKAMASLAVLRDSMIQGNWVDDRPPRSQGEWMKPLNEAMLKLIEKYPDPVKPYTEVDQTWVGADQDAGQTTAAEDPTGVGDGPADSGEAPTSFSIGQVQPKYIIPG